MEYFKSVLTVVSSECFQCYIVNATIGDTHSLKYACTWRLPLPLSPPPSLTQTHTHAHTLARVRKAHAKLPFFSRAVSGVGRCQPAGRGWEEEEEVGLSTLINCLRHSGVGLPSAICLRYGRELEKEGGGETTREEEKRKEETLERKRKEERIKGERVTYAQ